MSKEKTELTKTTIFCQNLKHEVEVEKPNMGWSSHSSPCDTCGSHGSVTLMIYKCACGKSHDIDVDSW